MRTTGGDRTGGADGPRLPSPGAHDPLVPSRPAARGQPRAARRGRRRRATPTTRSCRCSSSTRRSGASAGAPRLAYLARSLRALDESLGGRLVVRHGRASDVVPAVAREVDAPAVHVTAATEPYGRRRDDAVERALDGAAGPHRLAVRRRARPADHAGRARRSRCSPRSAARGSTTAGPPPRADRSGSRGRTSAPTASPTSPRRTCASRRPGNAPRTHAGRSTCTTGSPSTPPLRDRPDLDGTSMLSIPLKYGELHPRTLLADLAEAPFDVAHVPVRAGLARVPRRRPLAPPRRGAAVAADRRAGGLVGHRATPPSRRGRPGGPATRSSTPACASCARSAGCTTASAWSWRRSWSRTCTCAGSAARRTSWTWLVDGDVSQNQLNWQWVAGTGRDAAPYFRVFNPVTQGEKFDPDGAYVRQWVPELRGVPGRAVHQPWKLGLEAPEDYPAPIVDHAVERKVALDDFHRGRDASRRDALRGRRRAGRIARPGQSLRGRLLDRRLRRGARVAEVADGRQQQAEERPRRERDPELRGVGLREVRLVAQERGGGARGHPLADRTPRRRQHLPRLGGGRDRVGDQEEEHRADRDAGPADDGDDADDHAADGQDRQADDARVDPVGAGERAEPALQHPATASPPRAE